MDNPGQDLSRGIQEVSLNIERQITRTASQATLTKSTSHTPSHHDVVKSENTTKLDEKHDYPALDSSGSSSSDEVHMEKLDSRVIKIGDVKEGDEAFSHLPLHEKEIVKSQVDIPPVKVTYFTLFRYATRMDLIIIAISVFTSIAAGAVMPLMTVRHFFPVSHLVRCVQPI